MDGHESALRVTFGWVDYLLFSLTLLISSVIGIYHAWKSASVTNTTDNYLMGGKKMGIFPIAMSLAASSISATTLLGTPADVYFTGTMYMWIVVAAAFCILATSYLYLPLFYNLEIISVNHYLELRFHSYIRRFASLLYLIKQLFYMSIVVYAPSLALSHVTGIHVFASVSLMFVVCTFYTAIGGIKAVVWTDTIQMFLMYGSIITLLVKGVLDVGGLDVVWERNLNSSRIEFFNIDTDLATRHSIWSVLVGGFFYWTAWYATDQSTVQRFLAMPSLRKARTSMAINLVVMGGIITLSCFAGLLAYAKYFDCDPLTAKFIEKADQIIPYYVMDTVGNLPGLSGLFVAGVFSGALSTLSSGLNAVALVILEDFVRPFYPLLEDHTATRITKTISLLFACISFGSVFLISQVQTILDATLSFNGASGGAIFGVFTLGIFIPGANAIGAGIGMLVAFVFMMWLGVSTQIAKSRGLVTHNQMKPISIANCPRDVVNSSVSLVGPLLTNAVPAEKEPEEVFILLQLSYLWYTVIGMVIVIVLGTVISYATKKLIKDQNRLNPKLLVSSIVGSRQISERDEIGMMKRDQVPTAD